MNLIQDFNIRAEEVELYLRFANEFDCVETYKKKKISLDNVELNISRDLKKVIRANCYLVLYNLVESTVRESLWYVYDIISDNRITYEMLSENLKEMWLNQQAAQISELGNITKIKERIRRLMSLESSKEIIEFSRKRISLSGNLDYRSIEKILNDHSIYGPSNVDKTKLAKALLKVKNERNALAHGNKSFRQTAEIVTMQELINFKTLITQYLSEITHNVMAYINSEKFKCQSISATTKFNILESEEIKN